MAQSIPFGPLAMRAASLAVLAVVATSAARAQGAAKAAPPGGSADGGSDAAPADPPPWAGTVDTRTDLLGDLAGLRVAMDRHGIAFGLSETTEVLGNPSGGLKRGAVVEGLTQMGLGIDTATAFGLQGGTITISAFQIHGQGLTATNVGSLDVISSIEADPTTRLNELWYQQSFAGGALDIKLGQQSADLEFITSEYEDLFINSGFGWPTLPAVDLPSGGPAYPLATPGIRVRARPTAGVTLLAGLFDGSPAGLRPGDPQRNDPAGTNFDVSSGVFAIGEVQVAVNKEKDARGLPGTYKLGAWYNSNHFADAALANNGTAQPPGVLVGLPRSMRGDWSVYGTLDQAVYRPEPDGDGGLGLTARLMGGPADRNVIDVFAQGGATYKGAFGRNNDTLGLGMEWARIGARARAGDAAANASGPFTPIRTSEAVIEATYQAQIRPWWTVQPDLQYVIRPGGGIADPDRPGQQVRNTVVLGLRSVVTF